MGVPLVATRESNFGDWVSRFSMGYVCDASARSIAAAILAACSEHDSRHATLSANALVFARAHVWGEVGRRLSDFLLEVAPSASDAASEK